MILVTYETSFTMHGATGVILQPHQILHLPPKVTLVIDPCHIWTLVTMRGETGVIVQPQQILGLPRKTTLMMRPSHIWNAIYNARSNKCHCPTSPNTVPVTKNDSNNVWSLSHMKRHLQCAEQQVKLSNLTHQTIHFQVLWLLVSGRVISSQHNSSKTGGLTGEPTPHSKVEIPRHCELAW